MGKTIEHIGILPTDRKSNKTLKKDVHSSQSHTCLLILLV